jgi:hypothetical protein
MKQQRVKAEVRRVVVLRLVAPPEREPRVLVRQVLVRQVLVRQWVQRQQAP